MAEQIQELIQKIKSEGIEAAQKKADAIEEDARKKAEEIVSRARREADRLKKDAENETEKMRENARVNLQQASRDMLIQLRKKIEAVLQTIVRDDIDAGLSVERVAGIIEKVVVNYLESKPPKEDITVLLSPEDLGRLKKGFIEKLQKKCKEGLRFAPAEDIGKGFSISFDGGKSSFDFSDESLAEYLSAYLNPQLTDIIKNAVAK